MIPEIKKILYATDLSKNSAYAFRYAINAAMHHNAGIVILHVIEALPPATRAMISLYVDEEQKKHQLEDKIEYVVARIKKRLEIFCDKELKDRPECRNNVESIVVVEGYPEEEIIKKAKELNCDMVVMGTHGKGFLTQAFLGNVARRVLRRLRKPVMVIPLPEGEQDITFHDI